MLITDSIIGASIYGSVAEFLYGAPLAQRASNLVLHSSLLGPNGRVNDYIVNNSIKIGSRCISNGAQTNHH